jgi:hypothetical protein
MDIQELQRRRGTKVVDEAGEAIGELGDVYTDGDTDRPEWISIFVGILTTTALLVPVSQVHLRDDEIVVSVPADRVKNMEPIVADVLDEETERDLYEYYGLDYSERAANRTGPAQVYGRSVEDQPIA